MKKIIALIIAVATIFCFSLTGCSKVKPVAYENGEVKSGNGTFIVEKGEYLYFVNGIGDFEVTNKMGDALKGALLRMKTADLANPSEATIETVIPKLVTTSSATDGIYIFGDNVYFGTAFDEKDKKGTVRKDYTDFIRFDLKTAKYERITYESKKVTDYTFVENAGKVYLAYVCSETVDEVETITLKAFDASNGESLFEKEVASVMLSADNDNNKYVFYVNKAHSDALDADEAFDELYRYEIGLTEPELMLSGLGSAALNRDGNKEFADNNKNKLMVDKKGILETISGVKFSLIKNTGKALVFKSTDTDPQNSISKYYYADVEVTVDNTTSKVEDFSEKTFLGVSSTWLDAAVATKSYYKSASEIYYLETSTYVDHLVRFNYNEVESHNHGRTILTDSVKSMTLSFVDEVNEVMYFSESGSGTYYSLKYTVEGAEAVKINGSPMKTFTDWFVPRVVGNYFIGIYTSEIFTGYLYALDMTGIGSDEYADAIGKYATLDREKVLELKATMVGKMTEADTEAYQEKLDTDYPEEDEE